jgi:ubiquitin C-terminal hydrolase
MNSLCGLQNLGNTCYINSVLQCLAHTRPLLNIILNDDIISRIDTRRKSADLIREISAAFKLLRDAGPERRAMVPIRLINTIRTLAHKLERDSFAGHNQNDAHEFAWFLIDNIHEALSRKVSISYTGKPTTFLGNLAVKSIENWKLHFSGCHSDIITSFYAQSIAMIRCLTCGHQSFSFDPVCHMSVPVADGDCSIEECMDSYVKPEILDGDNAWMCDKCGVKRAAHRSHLFWNIPETFMLVLKKFRGGTQKINSRVSFDKTINMNKYVMTPSKSGWIYQPFAIVNHYGSLNSGHYTARILKDDDSWKNYDDMAVTDHTGSPVGHENYIIFIRKVATST